MGVLLYALLLTLNPISRFAGRLVFSVALTFQQFFPGFTHFQDLVQIGRMKVHAWKLTKCISYVD